jgi:hypothetical protein
MKRVGSTAQPVTVCLRASRHFVTALVCNKAPQAADTASEPRLTIKRLDDAFTSAAGRDHLRPLGGTVIGDRCYATVLLDEELRQSLAGLDPAHEVAWVHGCGLEHGHRGDHHALAYRAGPLSYWLQWDERSRPRISTTDRPDSRAREASPRGEPSGQPQHAERPNPATHSSTAAAEPPGSRKSGSQAEALWAIAVALERLADVIVGALIPAEATGRHAAGRDKRS